MVRDFGLLGVPPPGVRRTWRGGTLGRGGAECGMQTCRSGRPQVVMPPLYKPRPELWQMWAGVGRARSEKEQMCDISDTGQGPGQGRFMEVFTYIALPCSRSQTFAACLSGCPTTVHVQIGLHDVQIRYLTLKQYGLPERARTNLRRMLDAVTA